MTDAPRFLPYGRHCIDDEDIAAVVSVLRGDWLTTGPAVKAFEQAFAEKVGARFAVACSSGTAALHLCTMALGLAAEDRAVVPAVTFLATANAVRYVGAEVLFADVEADTGLIDIAKLRLLLSGPDRGRIKAILPVHLNGQTAAMEEISELAADYDLAVIEDACHALGSRYRLRDGQQVTVGSCRHSDLTVFSLHPVKTITMGEGGVITTNSPELYERLCRYRTHGMVREPGEFQRDFGFSSTGAVNPWYYEMPEIGFNYRASDINCALGLSQLHKLDRFVSERKMLSRHYDQALADLAPWLRPVPIRPGNDPALHLYVVHIDFPALGLDRAQVMDRLKDAGIGTQVHYLPVNMQPYYRNRYGDRPLPGAMEYYGRCLSLPLFPGMTTKDVDRVVNEIKALAPCFSLGKAVCHETS